VALLVLTQRLSGGSVSDRIEPEFVCCDVEGDRSCWSTWVDADIIRWAKATVGALALQELA
jgi:hypothetical protein